MLDAHTLTQAPVINIAAPPQGGGAEVGAQLGTGSLEHQRDRVLRGCFQDGISSKASSLVKLTMDLKTSQGWK